MAIDTLVLAGGKNSREMQNVTGTDIRALTVLGSQTMLAHVTDALRAAPSVGRIYVVGQVPAAETYTVLAPGDTLMDNLLAGITAARAGGSQGPILVSTSDIPFLTPASVEDFLLQAVSANADFCYPIIPIALCHTAFPEMKRTTLKLREGVFTGGNLMLVNPDYVQNRRETILRAYGARKNVRQIGAMLGWGLLARILVAQILAPGVLTIAQLERGVAHLLGTGCQARAIITRYPEIGTDIDSPADVTLARHRLSQ